MSSAKFICIDNQGYPVALELFAAYETLPDEHAEQRGLIRVIDESGEDYLYPKSRFVSTDITPDIYATLPDETKKALAKHVNRYNGPQTGRKFSAPAG